MSTNNSYIKIEIEDSIPIISIEYDSINSFQDLVFLLFSKSGSNLLSSTLEQELTLSNKDDEINILKAISTFIKSNDDIDDENSNFINPSSFK